MYTFVVLNIYKSTVRAELALIMRAFFMLVFKILRYIVPPCGTVMEPQHSRYVLSSGKDNIPFLLFMLNNIDNHQRTNNSNLMTTLIHDTDRMSSLEIAELTGKRHDAILRDIRNLLKQGVSHHNFVETSYKQPQPRGGYKELPCFELTKKGCLILGSGYDAVLREKIIDRWEQLELEKRKPQTPKTYLEALEALLASEKEKYQLSLENKQKEDELVSVQPKVEFAECIMKSSDCISVGDMANILNQNNLFGKGKISFYRWLRYNGYLIQRGIRYNHPSQKSMKNNLMRLVEVPYTTRGMVAFNTISMITPYGQKYFINLFRKMKAGKSQPELLFEK